MIGLPLVDAGNAYSTVQPASTTSAAENRPTSTSWRLYAPSAPEPLPVPPAAPVVTTEPPEPVAEELPLAGDVAPEDEAVVLEDALAAAPLEKTFRYATSKYAVEYAAPSVLITFS